MFYFILLFLLGVCNSSNPKLCINCKHLIKSYYSTSYSKCSQFPLFTPSKNTNYLVTGKSAYLDTSYFSCSIARLSESMCGTNGTKYRKKYTYKNKS